MTTKDKAALLARGEAGLARIEEWFDRAVQEGDFDMAWNWVNQYTGAIHMLFKLDLLPFQEYMDRSRVLHNHFMAARYPKEAEG